MEKRRGMISLVTGAVLGIFCIIGVGTRIGFDGNELFLFAMWYNRVIMGLLIGLASGIKIIDSDKNFIVRGLILGLLVTSAITLTSGFLDWPTFFAGIAYGVIIDWAGTTDDLSFEKIQMIPRSPLPPYPLSARIGERRSSCSTVFP